MNFDGSSSLPYDRPGGGSLGQLPSPRERWNALPIKQGNSILLILMYDSPTPRAIMKYTQPYCILTIFLTSLHWTIFHSFYLFKYALKSFIFKLYIAFQLHDVAVRYLCNCGERLIKYISNINTCSLYAFYSCSNS